MNHSDNLHSRLVARAKIFLPLVGLSLLATIFLFANSTEDTPSLPFAQVELEALAKEQRLDRPSFATVTEDGAELVLTSERVRPDGTNKDVLNSSRIMGHLKLPESGTVTLQAQNGVIDGPSGIAELSGDVHVSTTSGYTLSTDHIATLLNISKIESPGMIEGTAPFGQITAGSMEISQDSVSESYLLVFKQRVKLIYQP